MELSSVFHKTGSNYAYAYDKKRLHIKLQTKSNNIQEVFLVYGDPYDYREKPEEGTDSGGRWEWYSQYSRMEKTGSDGIHDYWLIEIEPEWKRLRYAFYLAGDGLAYLYSEGKTVQVSGFDHRELHEPMNFFAFPYINGSDVYQAPDWVKDTLWYQIFPERFANGDRSNDPEGVKDWAEPLTSYKDKYGGDLQGIIDHLDYLKELGINGIYMTPIFFSHSSHKYDTVDYRRIDPAFGNKELLGELVEKAHERGIKVMLDVVFNHCGFYHEMFQDVVEHGILSPYKDWFHIRRFPIFDKGVQLRDSKELNFDTFAYTPHMPKLNTENPQTKEYLLNIIRDWANAAAIDGWRLDVANEVDHQFWREFRTAVKEINPQAYILGEVWHDANPWLGGDQFDGVMNYPLKEAAVEFFAEERLNAGEFCRKLNRIGFQYPRHVQGNLYNLIDSHDTSRFISIAGKDKLKLAYVFLMTYPGAPSIYYGNEVGLTGKIDHDDNRRPMLWKKEEQDLELLEFMKRLIQIRKAHGILRQEGEIRFLHQDNDPDILLYKRYQGEQVYYILINRSERPKTMPLPEEMNGQAYTELWEEIRTDRPDTIELKPYGFAILKKRTDGQG